MKLQILKGYVKVKITDFKLDTNRRTFRCKMFSSKVFDFKREGFGRSLLGFRGYSKPDTLYVGEARVMINHINSIRVMCNIAGGAYLNGNRTHAIYEFYPEVPPGYKVIIIPRNIIYFPVNVKILDTVSIIFKDQDNNDVSFNGEEINLRLHMKKVAI